ncbi:MAG: sodium:proton antiporter NhaD, partial [Candidatus Woesearchaeota archaeon]|nr:sodium:proton antiporter NhaD [Candidatus Woesearchaeota archaeon]
MAYFFLIGVFFIGYLAIILEHKVKLNKAAIAIFMAVASWAIFFSSRDFHLREGLHMLDMHLCQVAQVVFFLLGAMTIVELMDSHGSFTIITKFIQTKSQRKMLWLIGLVAFFLSAVLDNLTTTILIVSVLRKLIEQRSERLIFSCLVVVAANAGGAWTPIGDVTTTMLWIQGQLSSLSVMRSLFIPS